MTWPYKTTMCVDVPVCLRAKKIAEEYFGTLNGLSVEAIREGLRSFNQFSQGRERRCARRLFLEEHGGGTVATEHVNMSLRIPGGLMDRMEELGVYPLACFFRIWLAEYLNHPDSFWEGRE